MAGVKVNKKEYERIVTEGLRHLHNTALSEVARVSKIRGSSDPENFKIFYVDAVVKLLPVHSSQVAEELRAHGYDDAFSIKERIRNGSKAVDGFQDEVLERVPLFEEELSETYRAWLGEKINGDGKKANDAYNHANFLMAMENYFSVLEKPGRQVPQITANAYIDAVSNILKRHHDDSVRTYFHKRLFNSPQYRRLHGVSEFLSGS